MHRWIVPAILGITLTFVAAQPAWADTAEQLFDQLFGEAARRAAATPETSDDADLAGKVFKSAENLKDSDEHRAFKMLLYRQAFEFGARDPASMYIADQAVEKLMRYDRDNRNDWLRKQVEAYYQAYLRSPREDKPERGDAAIDMAISAGDRLMNAEDYTTAMQLYKRGVVVATQLRSPRRAEVDALVRAAGQKSLMKRKLDGLLGRFKARPDDKLLARQIVNAYVVDFDRPIEAVAYAEVAGDAAALAALKAVATDADQVAADDAIKAAEWYEALAAASPKDAQNPLRQRALGLYEVYLDKNPAGGVETMKAKLKIEQLTAAISGDDATDGATTSTGHTTTVDLLKLIDVEKHGSRRDWLAKDGKIASLANRYDSELVAPVTVTGSYQITVRAKMPPLSLDDFDPDLYVMLPFGEKDQSYFFISGNGYAEPRLGVARQPRRMPAWLQPGRTHTIVVRVEFRGEKAQIQAAVDGKKICAWSGLVQEASTYSYLRVGKPTNPGLRVNDGQMVIIKYEIKPLGSDGKIEKDPNARPYWSGGDHND